MLRKEEQCPNEFGTYKGCKYLSFPGHMLKENSGFYKSKEGCLVDYCIVDEIQFLWNQGISTYGSCCGHGINEGIINVDKKNVPQMLKLGYELLKVPDGFCQYTFIPKSKHI